jgi:hypothetical protein
VSPELEARVCYTATAVGSWETFSGGLRQEWLEGETKRSGLFA